MTVRGTWDPPTTTRRRYRGSPPRLTFIAAIAGCVAASALGWPLDAPAGEPGHTFVVNLTSDESDASVGGEVCDIDLATAGNQCTLRAALEEANVASDPDSIHFGIPGRHSHVIAPQAALPEITHQVVIDGYTQP